MKLGRQGLAVVFVSITGCADDEGGARLPDGPGASVCGMVTGGVVDFRGYDPRGSIAWGGPVTGTLPDGNQLYYQFEFYGGIEPTLSGTFDLTLGNQQNYSTCAVCVRAFGVDANNKIVKRYFHNAGTITLNGDPLTTKNLDATISGLRFEEVTIAQQTAVSTPVQGGQCGELGDFAVQHDHVPNAFTCPHADWDSGASCNCNCGLPDPDCLVDSLPTLGCTTAGDVCFNDACVTPPANDTCATATELTVNAPATAGTTVGAKRDYARGLEAATCTNLPQLGPDVVYKVELTAQAYTVKLTGLDARYDASVALVGPASDASVCEADPIGLCVRGADRGLNGDNESFQYTVTNAGTYYIIVDSWHPAVAGAFSIQVTQP